MVQTQSLFSASPNQSTTLEIMQEATNENSKEMLRGKQAGLGIPESEEQHSEGYLMSHLL
jgi:hypothetical protein